MFRGVATALHTADEIRTYYVKVARGVIPAGRPCQAVALKVKFVVGYGVPVEGIDGLWAAEAV